MLGLFDSSHMPYNIDSDHAVKPTLAEMVGKALDVLEKDPKGYFLFVEGKCHFYPEKGNYRCFVGVFLFSFYDFT